MRRNIPILALLAVLAAAGTGAAKTYNTPTIDGHVTEAAGDWQADELAVADPSDDERWYPSDPDLVDMYVTWDADSLYVGITTTRSPGSFGDGYLLFMDTDAQNGVTGATDFTASVFYPRHITFSTMGVDVVMGGWNLPVHFDVMDVSDILSPTPLSEVHTQANPGWQHVEAAFSWNGLFGLGEGVVPAGTTIRFVSAIVGGDNSGAYDAAPTTSTAIETNPATAWDAYTDLDVYYEAVVDADGNGVPDTGYPPGGAISGTVTLDDPSDTETVVTVTAYQNGQALGSGTTPAGGGEYIIPRLLDGDYDVTARAFSYLDSTRTATVQNEQEVTGVDFTLTRVNGAIEGAVALTGGPPVDVTVTAYDATTGLVAGDGPQLVTGGAGSFRISTVLDGSYHVEATGKGYVEQTTDAVVAEEDTVDVGVLTLPAVVATKYGFTDSTGASIYATGTTVSLPGDSIYYYAQAWVQPRDADGRVAYWDQTAQDSISLGATSLDPFFPPQGSVLFAAPDGSPLPSDMITSSMFDDGRAEFLVADDAIEVVRVRASHGSLGGVLEVGIDAAAATRLMLSADVTTIVAGEGAVHVTGQLLDASGNDARVSGVRVSMLASGVGGHFSLVAPETDPNGRFELDFTGTIAGDAQITGVMEPGSPYENVVVNTIDVVIEPNVATLVATSVEPAALRAGDSGTLTAQIVDAYGNAVPQQGLVVSLTASPAGLLASLETPIMTDADGTATSSLAAGAAYGVVEISGTTASLPVSTVYLPIDATIVAVDQAAPESDSLHNSDPGVDLTIMRATNGPDTLAVTLDFYSNWDGVHLAVIMDTHGDAAGGTTDPFGFPINYAQPDLPDYCFTYKYAAGDYADLRRFNQGQWEHYNFDTQAWQIGYTDGVNAVTHGLIVKTDKKVVFKIPLTVVDAATVGDTVRLEAYVMQETEGQKRTALDSVPADATHDMLPPSGNWWDTATDPVTLSNYAEYVIRAQGYPPNLADGVATPATARPGDLVTYTIEVTDGGGGVGDVLIDLSPLGGEALTRMRDDGLGADDLADDDIFTAADTLSASAVNGDHTVTVTARDAANVSDATFGIAVTVDNPATALRSFDDPEGDDHGPNHLDAGGDPVPGLYYFYPTNNVFVPGSFDITKVEISADGNQLVFRVTIKDLVDAEAPGSADWGAPQPSEQTCSDPFRTDLNLQKIDIYIDAREGEGATSGFPNRYVDIAKVDAWDYGISIEGWGKWFVKSNGLNSIASWTLYKNDSDVSLCDNYDENTIDIRVNRDLFGQDLDADNLNLQEWDIIVCISSHDGDSNDSNLGAIRWVNANTSEWQFGGGRDGEAGRERDANIIDVAVSQGASHEPGRTQEEMLDYTTDEAEERFASNETACVLEASFAIDTSPPVVAPFPSDPDVRHIPWIALNGAPAVLWTTITDVSGVDVARFVWHPLGAATADSVRMVNLTGDIWAADISRADIVAASNVVDLNKTGPARVIKGYIMARDASPLANEIRTTPREIAFPEPWPLSQTIENVDQVPVSNGVAEIVFQDGTVITLDATTAASRSGISLTLTPLEDDQVDVSEIRSDMTYVGVARDIAIDWGNVSPGDFLFTPTLTLHYPQYDVGGLDERKFGIFYWEFPTERWVMLGGGASAANNKVTVGVPDVDAGRVGIFYWDKLGFGDSSGLAGVLAEPNPFSPNGDGLYDETVVSFYLGRPANYVNVEFYDLGGRLARRLVFRGATDYTGRTPVRISWDGRDMNGDVVPYGIYVMRVEANFKTEPTFERVNVPVVVIK